MSPWRQFVPSTWAVVMDCQNFGSSCTVIIVLLERLANGWDVSSAEGVCFAGQQHKDDAEDEQHRGGGAPPQAGGSHDEVRLDGARFGMRRLNVGTRVLRTLIKEVCSVIENK